MERQDEEVRQQSLLIVFVEQCDTHYMLPPQRTSILFICTYKNCCTKLLVSPQPTTMHTRARGLMIIAFYSP